MRQDTSYQYAIGRIRALEIRLMGPSDFSMLAETAEPDRFVSALYAFGYPEVSQSDYDRYGLDASGDPDGLLRLYEKLIPDFRNDQVRELMRFCPEPELLAGFLSDTDFANAKTCVKYKARGALTERTLSGRGGNIPADIIFAAISRGETDKLPGMLSEGIKEAEKILAGTGTPRFADFAIDKAYFAHLRGLVKKSSLRTRRFLGRYLDAWCDLKNILSCVRIGNTEDAQEEFSRCYLPGKISEEQFKHALAGGISPWTGTVYEELFRKETEEKGIDPADMERFCDDYLLDLGRSAASDTDTVGPVFAYLLSRKREIMNIRLLLVGKRGGVKARELMKMIRRTV